jgi:DNA polymerase-3 subunit epsilon
MRLDQIEFAAIDFESSGYGADGKDEPIQVGIAIMRGGRLRPAEGLRSFIQPASPRPISDAAYAVHRIGSERLLGAPTMVELWPEIRGRLKDRVVVAHGAGTEKRFLRTFPMHGFRPWLDTLTIARRCLSGLPDYSLGGLVGRLGLEEPLREQCPDLDWHDALFDAAASLLLLKSLAEATHCEDDPMAAFDA